LLIALALTGIVWLIHAWQARQRQLAGAPPVPESQLLVQSRAAFPVLLFVVLFRSFLLEPYRIPSASMMPNLVAGDFIVVSKFAYGLRLPLLNTKLIPIGTPQRGDVVVFRSPTEHIDLIKRLIGLPGDHVVVRDNHLWINGQPVPLEPAGTFGGDDGFDGAQLARERLDHREHTLMFAPVLPATDFEGTVPAHRYFFMGDNRNDSQDSRFPQVGFVSEESLVGPALVIWMNWRFPGWPAWNRVGKVIH
jgi:signal peptidase I